MKVHWRYHQGDEYFQWLNNEKDMDYHQHHCLGMLTIQKLRSNESSGRQKSKVFSSFFILGRFELEKGGGWVKKDEKRVLKGFVEAINLRKPLKLKLLSTKDGLGRYRRYHRYCSYCWSGQCAIFISIMLVFDLISSNDLNNKENTITSNAEN